MSHLSVALPLAVSKSGQPRADLITARALRRSLLPDFDLADVAAELAALAGNERAPLNRAISRIDRSITQRPSVVAERAELALLVALEVVAERAA